MLNLKDSKWLQSLGVKDHLRDCEYCWFRLNNQAIIWENQTTEHEKELLRKSEEIKILKEQISSKATFLSNSYHEVHQRKVEIDLLRKDMLSTSEEINRLTTESASKIPIINKLTSQVDKMNMKVDKMKKELFSKLEYIGRIEADFKKRELEIIQTERETLDKKNHKIIEIEHIMKELLFKLENFNKMERELKMKDLEIEQIKNFNTKLIQELSSNKEIIHKQEINLKEQFEIVGNLDKDLLENRSIIEKKDMQYIELNKEIETLRGEMAEIVNINENQKLVIDENISQFNQDLQVKQSEIDELKSLTKSRQKFRPPVTDNPTKFWT